MWETQPLTGYASGPVSIVAPDVLQTASAASPPKNAWFVPCDLTYGGTTYGGDRWTLAKLQGVPAGGVTSLHAKVYDPGGTGSHGWSLVLKDAGGKILDFGIWAHAATGKIYPFQYDGSSWAAGSPWFSRYKSGNDYYTIDLSQNLDGTLSWTITGLKVSDGSTYTGTGTTTVAYGTIVDVYLTGRTQTTAAVNFKWTEFSYVPEPATLTLLALSGLPLLRRRRA
jgi:hypothetical protein